METKNQQPVDLNDLLHKIKSGEIDYQARPLSEIAQEARLFLKLSREQFYQNLVTLQWGPPRLDSFSNPSTDWYHEVSYDRRALIEDPTVILLMWPHHQPIPKDIADTADFLGHDFGCEYYSEAWLRVTDEDARWEWQQRFVPQDKESTLAGETE